VKETADKLLVTAERCFRLAMSITDRKTIERLLEMGGSARSERRRSGGSRTDKLEKSEPPSIGVMVG
jgi:hypothetical protein